MARATRSDVAKLAGVSVATVSHVMNGRAEELGFFPETAQRVKAAADQLGYIPKASARALRYQRSRIIGLFLGEIPSSLHLPVFNELLLSSIDQAIEHKAYVVPILCSLGKDSNATEVVRKALSNLDLVGAICESSPSMLEIGRLLKAADVPVVWINPRGRECIDSGIAELGIDEVVGVKELMDALSLPTSAKILALQGPGESPKRFEPLSAYGQVEIVYADSWEAPAGSEAIKRFYKQRDQKQNHPDLIFAANDLLAIGTLSALKELQVCVPGQIQVVGYGDFDQAAALLITKLSTVHWPLTELGSEAINVLMAWADNPVKTDQRNIQILPTTAQIRETTI